MFIIYKFVKFWPCLSILRHLSLFKFVNMTERQSCDKTDDSTGLATLKRLTDVEGLDRRINDIIFISPEKTSAQVIGRVVFFGGDVQDYPENMMMHRDNQRHIDWNLEKTAELLHQKFPHWKIHVVKPSRMHLKTFSCYENFVDGNDNGVPCHELSTRSIRHLMLLLHSGEKLTSDSVQCSKNNSTATDDTILIGFSKGCVVLNQLLYSFSAMKINDENLLPFIKSIKSMYWLDGGHSGGKNTWVTNKPVLKHFSTMGIHVNIHVSPYQMQCESRPWIRKEEKVFRETLKRFGAKVSHVAHFEDEPRSLESHFRILNNFV